MKTFDSFSFGCRVNQAEKEALDRELVLKGYSRTTSEPDVYILNTCSVTHKAEREAKQHIYQIHRQFPSTKIVVTGCAATNWKKTNETIEGIDLLVDNQSKEYIAEILEKRYKLPKKGPAVDAGSQILVNDKFMRSGRVIIKIQDGCHRFCSFCIVPYLRGLPVSVSTDTLLDKVKEFEKSNFKEVIVTAINTEAYGRDSGETFVNFLDRLFTETNIPRFSFGSIHPWTFTQEFLDFYARYAQSSRFVHFFHIPLQSGSNKILNLMKRGYTREEFIEKLNKIKDLNPFAFIGTDVIVGYLEEEDADFEDTYKFMEQTPISKFHVFRFSTRQHTAAFHMAKRLKMPTVEQKKARSERLRKLSEKKYFEFIQTHVGHQFEALILERREGEYQQALLGNQILSMIKSPEDRCGEILKVEIAEIQKDKLLGRII
ncbi:MiaB/RimO family radical SAM methylthiotransferase [Candidatus Woesebacteria bacterium]|nr:MiaB/RimO family radical SAM methylthiotransferase [Candidatus Woesebacteria bacterium]